MFHKGVIVKTAIILFHYKRVENLSIQLNVIKSVDLPIYIFVDYDNDCDGENILEYEKLIEGFKRANPEILVELICQRANLGLRSSVLSGLSYVSRRVDAFIVFEDDIIFNEKTIEYFLTSLRKYGDTDVYHINGWCHPNWYPFKRRKYFWGHWAFCWGWATWSSKWDVIELDAEQLLSRLGSRKKEFNIYGSYRFTDQLEKNQDKSMSTWAVFWTATIFVNGGKCLCTAAPHCKPLVDHKFTNAKNPLAYKNQRLKVTFEQKKLPSNDLKIDQKESIILFIYVRFIHGVLSKYQRLKTWVKL